MRKGRNRKQGMKTDLFVACTLPTAFAYLLTTLIGTSTLYLSLFIHFSSKWFTAIKSLARVLHTMEKGRARQSGML
jgi:hypothetical protein